MKNFNMQGAKTFFWLEIRFQINWVEHKTAPHSTVMYFPIFKYPSIPTNCVLSQVQSIERDCFLIIECCLSCSTSANLKNSQRVKYWLTQIPNLHSFYDS